MAVYVALLRGINVGGHTKVSMSALRDVFAGLGHDDVTTYLQSGNVVFQATAKATALAKQIEKAITTDLGLEVSVLLRTDKELAKVAQANPFLDRAKELTHLHVTFLADKPKASLAAAVETPSGESGEFSIAGREVYLHTPGGYGRSKLTNAYFEKALGVPATSRGWKTVMALVDLTTT